LLGLAGESLTADGYIELSNGLIIQWGSDTFPTSGNTNITLPKAYTTTHFAAYASQGTTGNISANWYATTNSGSLTTIKIGAGAAGGAGFWISIGV